MLAGTRAYGDNEKIIFARGPVHVIGLDRGHQKCLKSGVVVCGNAAIDKNEFFLPHFNDFRRKIHRGSGAGSLELPEWKVKVAVIMGLLSSLWLVVFRKRVVG